MAERVSRRNRRMVRLGSSARRSSIVSKKGLPILQMSSLISGNLFFPQISTPLRISAMKPGSANTLNKLGWEETPSGETPSFSSSLACSRIKA